MAIKQRLDDRGDYLYVEATGQRSVEAIKAAHEQLADHCRRHMITRVLVDTRAVRGTLNTMELHEMGTHLACLREAGIDRMAVVQSEAYRDRFGETVAVNRGYPVRIFFDLEQAERWVRG